MEQVLLVPYVILTSLIGLSTPPPTSDRLALGKGGQVYFLLYWTWEVFCLVRKIAAAPCKGKASQIIATGFLLDYKVFNELQDTRSALSRSAFFVNQVTCLWAPAMLMELVELGQQKFFSGVWIYLLLGCYFPQKPWIRDPHCLSKVTNCKNCIGFIVFLFSPKMNFLLAGIAMIPDVIKT